MTPNIKLGQPLTGNSVRHHLHRLHLYRDSLQKSKAAVTERSKSNLITKSYSSASSPLLYMTAMETDTFVFQGCHFLLLCYTSTMFKVLK